jgi:hypothetical protein
LNGAWKLSDKAIASTSEYASAILTNQFADVLMTCVKRLERTLLIERSQSAEADHIGGENDCELSIHGGNRSFGQIVTNVRQAYSGGTFKSTAPRWEHVMAGPPASSPRIGTVRIALALRLFQREHGLDDRL